MQIKDLHPVIRDILHLGLYQIYELDKIPDEECTEEYGGMIKRYTFHSKEAYDAYRLACDDCFGWQGYGFVDADAEIIGIEKAEKFFNGEDD